MHYCKNKKGLLSWGTIPLSPAFLTILFLLFYGLNLPITCAARNIPTTKGKKECAPQKKSIQIKVLLSEHKIVSQKLFKVSSSTAVSNPKKTSTLEILLKNNSLYARAQKKQSSFLRKKKSTPFKKIKFSKTGDCVVTLSNRQSNIVLDGQEYRGSIIFALSSKDKKLYVINKLDLEDYVYAVLRAESYPTWPNEMQKIQAIISRSYAIHQIMEKKKGGKSKKSPPPHYDIKRNTYHQRYNGDHTYHHLRQAVDETKGLILTYRDDAALTMFDACCGGSIPAYIKGINFEVAPYLARMKPCHFCKDYCLYRWKRKITIDDFYRYLKNYKPTAKKLFSGHKILSATVEDRDRAGVVHSVKIRQPRGGFFISGKDLWMSMNNLMRSQNFTIKKTNKHLYIFGRGFGHQIGLCQRGARELVRQGKKCKEILQFYYPNTTLAKLRPVKSKNKA